MLVKHCPWGKADYQHPGLHEEGCHQQDNRGDPSHLLRTSEEYSVHLWAPQYERDLDMRRESSEGTLRSLRDWSISHMRKG